MYICSNLHTLEIYNNNNNDMYCGYIIDIIFSEYT